MIGTIYRTEIRMLLRDRRTIITSIILPLLITPLMLFSGIWITKKRQESLNQTTYQYAVTGPEAGTVRSLLEQARKIRAADTNDGQKASFKFEEKSVTDPQEALTKREIHFFLQGLTADATYREATNSDDSIDVPLNKMPEGLPIVRAVFRGDRDDSSAGVSRLENELRETRRQQREELLLGAGFPVPLQNVAPVSTTNVASEQHVA